MKSFARTISPACFALAAISALASAPAQAQQPIPFFVTSAGPARAAISAASTAPTGIARRSRGGRRGRQDLARLSLARRGRGERKGPHRPRPLAERQGRRGRQGRRRTARRQQQPHQADRAEREGRGHQRPRRHAEPSRRPHRLAGGRHGVRGRRRPHLRQLDQARRAPRWSAIRIAPGSTTAPAKSWNASHPSRGPGGGCAQADLKSTGGDGLIYCFACGESRRVPSEGAPQRRQPEQAAAAGQVCGLCFPDIRARFAGSSDLGKARNCLAG